MIRVMKIDAFHFQQDSFHFQTALVATKRPVVTDCPVAWDNDGKRIGRQGHSDRAGSFRMAHVFRDETVGADSAAGNGVFCSQDFLLKCRTKINTNGIQRESNILALQKRFYPIQQSSDLRTRRFHGVWNKLADRLCCRGFRLGQRDAVNLRFPPVDRPERSHGAERGGAQTECHRMCIGRFHV